MNRDKALEQVKGAVGSSHDTAHGYTNPYGAQCLAFIAWYTEMLGYKSIMPGYNAIDVFTKNPLNLPETTTPEPGDLFFQNMTSGGVNYGHTGVVSSVTNIGIYGIAQNARNPSLSIGSPASEDFYSSKSIAGYLRPSFKGGNMPNVEKILQSALNSERNVNEILQSALNAERKKSEVLESALNAERNKVTSSATGVTREQVIAYLEKKLG